jgi:hypothetical protein
MIDFSWSREGTEFVSTEFDYKESTSWAWAWIVPGSSGEFRAGKYTVALTLRESGDTVTLPFTIE